MTTKIPNTDRRVVTLETNQSSASNIKSSNNSPCGVVTSFINEKTEDFALRNSFESFLDFDECVVTESKKNHEQSVCSSTYPGQQDQRIEEKGTPIKRSNEDLSEINSKKFKSDSALIQNSLKPLTREKGNNNMLDLKITKINDGGEKKTVKVQDLKITSTKINDGGEKETVKVQVKDIGNSSSDDQEGAEDSDIIDPNVVHKVCRNWNSDVLHYSMQDVNLSYEGFKARKNILGSSLTVGNNINQTQPIKSVISSMGAINETALYNSCLNQLKEEAVVSLYMTQAEERNRIQLMHQEELSNLYLNNLAHNSRKLLILNVKSKQAREMSLLVQNQIEQVQDLEYELSNGNFNDVVYEDWKSLNELKEN